MYLLDANIFIQAKNRHYAFDVVPGFWRWLERAHGIGIAGSVERVREELLVGQDELADWARTHSSFFQPIDDDTAACFRPLLEWASSAPAGYKSAALNEFSSDAADFLLVAHALAHRHVVVTHEVPSPNSSRRVKIPDACKALGVEWESPFAMLRKSKAKFDLVESFAPGHSSDSGRPGKDKPDRAGDESNGGQGLLF